MSNKKLLDWAVENVGEWDSEFKYLRSDRTGVFFYNRRRMVCKGRYVDV